MLLKQMDAIVQAHESGEYQHKREKNRLRQYTDVEECLCGL